VQVAGRFASEVWIERRGTRANGKSIMSVLSLAAGKGSELTITAEGADAEEAAVAVVDLIENDFEVA
jgi:phosphocarrier protein